jgi:hypothetical protein
MAKEKIFLLLLAAAVLDACGEPKETCKCTCTCGSGEKSTIEGASNEDDCASSCDMTCGADSNRSNFDCRTEGATSETPTNARR